MKNTLCWTCKNCTSVNKCEFVKRINDYYEEQRKNFLLTRQVQKGNNIFFEYKPIKDLTQFYIQGTETDKNGNITKCPCYQKEENQRPENEREYIEQISTITNECIRNLQRKNSCINAHFARVKTISQEEREQKRKKANEYIQNILLNRKVVDFYKQGYFPYQIKKGLLAMQDIEQKQERLQELERLFLQRQQGKHKETKNKKINARNYIVGNKLLTSQEKKYLLSIKNLEERQKKFYEIIDLKNREYKKDIDLSNFQSNHYNFEKMTDNELIDYIQQVNACYVNNNLGKNLTDSEIQSILVDYKRIIKNSLLFGYLPFILTKIDFESRKKAEQKYLEIEQRRLEIKRKYSERRKQVLNKKVK